MIKFICDTCNKEQDLTEESKHTGNIIPSYWITLSTCKFENLTEEPSNKNTSSNLIRKKVIYSGGKNYHFCSELCFINYFVYLPTLKNRKKMNKIFITLVISGIIISVFQLIYSILCLFDVLKFYPITFSIFLIVTFALLILAFYFMLKK